MSEKPTKRKLVLQELIQAKQGKRYFTKGGVPIPAGWVPSWVICDPGVGGLQGTRRLRELKEIGIRYDWKYLEMDGESTNTTIYRLITPVEWIDIENMKVNQPTKKTVEGQQLSLWEV